MNSTKFSRRAALLGVLPCAWTASAHSQEAFPSKPISLVVSLQAGSGSDVASRLVAEQMAGKLGVPVVVENLPGAGGLVGAAKVFNARPDGYTLGALNNGLVCLVPNLPAKPAFDIAQLSPVGLVADLPSVLVVPASLPVQNLADLVAYSKRNKGTLSYGSVGLGSPQHIGMEMLKGASGLDMLHVPYKGGPQAVADVVAGQIQATWIAIPVATGFIKSGQLKALAVGGGKRSSLLPLVPTLKEAGVSEFEYVPWIGFYAPPHTPIPIATRLNLVLQEILRDSAVADKLLRSGLEAAPMSLAAFEQRGTRERNEMATVIQQLNLS